MYAAGNHDGSCFTNDILHRGYWWFGRVDGPPADDDAGRRGSQQQDSQNPQNGLPRLWKRRGKQENKGSNSSSRERDPIPLFSPSSLFFAKAQFIAQSIGQAFQVAYMEFLKANGIEDQSFVREMDYQEVLNSQEIFGDELQMFAKKELQKEV